MNIIRVSEYGGYTIRLLLLITFLLYGCAPVKQSVAPEPILVGITFDNNRCPDNVVGCAYWNGDFCDIYIPWEEWGDRVVDEIRRCFDGIRQKEKPLVSSTE